MSLMATAHERQKYHFYTGREYYPALCERIKQTKAGDRVLLATLWVLPEEPPVAAVLKEARAAAKRGVEVILLTDAFMFLIRKGMVPGPTYFFGQKPVVVPKRFRERFEALRELERAGGKFMVINQPRRALAYPFKGRSHIKYSVVNDVVYIGGSNLSNSDFLDVMACWEDKHIADWLDQLTRNILRTGSILEAMKGEDQAITVDARTKLIVDAGAVGKSMILEKAFEVIDSAKEKLLITYQYFPEGVTAKHLVAAINRGVKLRAYYNHHSIHPKPLNIIYGTVAWKVRRKGPVEFSTHRLPRKHPDYLHAKVLANEKAVVLSSHNYSMTGVDYGTAEIGLISTDPVFVRGVVETIEKQLQ